MDVTSDRLLRPNSRLDIILDLDILTGQADVRSSMILDVTARQVVVLQTEPAILKSLTGREVEATLVHHNLITYETTRWGWQSRIVGLNNAYRFNSKDQGLTADVIFLSPPDQKGLQKTNVRQAYRLDIGAQTRAELKIEDSAAEVNLLNFSAGGFMLSTPVPAAFGLGQTLTFSLNFLYEEDDGQASIRGKATVVRQEYEPGDRLAKLGLKFLDMDAQTVRTMQRVINRYMLEEQRRRNREL